MPNAARRNFAILLALAGVLLPLWDEGAESAPRLRSGKFTITDADRAWWAFQPVHRPAVPPLRSHRAASHPIDAFVLSRLEEMKLTMNPPATPRELVRRAYFDLLGLPPSPEDVAAFERHPTDAAWEQLIERLLASPHYGERWGRHWLDLVRYAESNGYERDGAKPHAWRYRDYVINAFNEDKPYDRFVREQLAGDEIAEASLGRAATASNEWRDAIVATGFYRLHVWDDEPDSTVAAEYDDLDDIMVATSTAFLGLTIGCARCHDHKFDPISQADYYSMLSFFRSIDPYGMHKTGGGGRGTGKIDRVLATPEELSRWRSERAARIKEAEKRVAAVTNTTDWPPLEAELKKAKEASIPFDFALAVAEIGSKPKPTFVLARGDALSPRAEVSPAFPAVLGFPVPPLREQPTNALTTGRRRVLADWIASPQNPLTARVMANRIWQRHFGTGIAPTPDDFGQTGLRPTNQPLLDYLAAEFVADGWSVKRLHRFIMTSRAYRASSSAAENPRAQSIDESNTLLWRQNLRRLEAEAIRDTMLVISGTLNPKQGGPSVFPELPKEVHGTQDSSGKGWSDSPPEEQNRRSVYLVVKRALKVPLLECLDFANSSSPVGARPVTTTAPQALMLLNDGFVQAKAAALADRIVREAGKSQKSQIERAFQVALQRRPTGTEMKSAQALLADQRQRAAEENAHLFGGVWPSPATASSALSKVVEISISNPLPSVAAPGDGRSPLTTFGKAVQPERVALISFCRALLNLNETIYVD